MREIAFRQQAELDLVEDGRAVLAGRLPDVAFDAPMWDLAALKKKKTGVSSRAYWTRHGTTDEPLPPHFIEPVKAAVALDLKSPTNTKFKADAARFLWRSLEERDVASKFRWETATVQDMLQMEQTMRANIAASSTNKSCGAWNKVLQTLTNAGVIPPMKVNWVTPRPQDSERYTLAGREERMQLLLSIEALEALAEMYRGKVTAPADRLVLCVIALMVATGLRIGEVLTLPRDCLFYIGNGTPDKPRSFGLRFWPEKGGDERDMETRWIPRSAARLVVSAVREARRVTASASARAKEIVEAERTTGVFPLPGRFSMRKRLSCEEVARSLGFSFTGSGASEVKYTGVRSERVIDGKKEFFVAPEDLRQYLAGRQKDTTHVASDGKVRQRFDESLFVVHVNQLHPGKGTNPLLVEGLGIQAVNDALMGRWATAEPDHPEAMERDGKWMRPLIRSLFDRCGYTERDGSPIEITTHQFRHWVTTQASAGQAEDAVIVRWQNRRHAEELNAYKHLTTEQRVEMLRRALDAGNLGGELAEVYFNLAEDLRDAFLEAQVQHVHVTDVGLCVHDFSVSPCPHHLNCLKGCGDYVTDRSDPVQRQQLVQLEIRTRKVVEAELEQADEEGEEVSENWIDEHRTVLANLQKINAMEPGGLVRPFGDSPSRFSPIEEVRGG
jgi:hypothetical protein